MPGSNARAIEKARTLPADGVILDLEDAVAPDAKEAARKQVTDAVKAGGFGSREVFIRINGIETPWHADDLAAAAAAGPDAILIPKVGRVWAMIETPEALFNIVALAAEAHDSETRLAGFVMGTNDLAKETRARLIPGRAPMASWLTTCLLAAHAHGIDILDGVYNDLSDAEGFEAECIQGRDMGFDGKTLIHPNQIEPCNVVFSPSAAEVGHARKLIAAFDLPENKNKGVVQVEGRMVERMHAEMARRTVAIAEAIEQAHSQKQPA
jgi:citrate lyase subunit beta/citryl-CoA lyase